MFIQATFKSFLVDLSSKDIYLSLRYDFTRERISFDIAKIISVWLEMCPDETKGKKKFNEWTVGTKRQ